MPLSVAVGVTLVLVLVCVGVILLVHHLHGVFSHTQVPPVN